MSEKTTMQYWEVWYPNAAATGLLVGRGQLDPTDRLILHAAPEVLTVAVSDENGQRLASGQNLKKTLESPMCLLTRQGNEITRQDIWPGEEHIGTLVLLPGGEVGVLKVWWHAEDRQEWRWQVEFYNSKR